MKEIVIDYSYNIELDAGNESHIEKAELFRNAICKDRSFTDKQLQAISDYFRIPITWASSAMEGTTYTIGETQTLLEGITVQGKSLKETFEILGHAEAFDYMMQLGGRRGLGLDDICRFHALLFGKAQPEAAGLYKTVQNFISGSGYTTVLPQKVPQEMEKLADWIEDNYDTMHPIVLAAEVHRKLVYIHPFDDGSGRCARLCMNALMLQKGYLPCLISPALRMDYITSLEVGRSGRVNDFIRFIAEVETETQEDYMQAQGIPLPVSSVFVS